MFLPQLVGLSDNQQNTQKFVNKLHEVFGKDFLLFDKKQSVRNCDPFAGICSLCGLQLVSVFSVML